MLLASPINSHDLVQNTLERYDEALLRQVADKLIKPRNQWPIADLIERSVATIGNAAVIDRRLQDLESVHPVSGWQTGHRQSSSWRS